MIRALHRWPGLLAMALIMLLALSGAALSVFPAAERLSAPALETGLSVAELAGRIQAANPNVEQIKRAPSGRITAYWFENGVPGAAVIDPATGAAAASADPSTVERWLKTLHRSLFLDDAGRLLMAACAAAMLVLCITGALLVARRAGGWRRWFAPLRGPLAGRLHVEMARISVAGLALSALTALWMTASTFGLLPDEAAALAPNIAVSGQVGMAPAAMETLAHTPAVALRELTFPYHGDATDVFTLTTDKGTGLLDQGSGALLAWRDLSVPERISETVYMLHTGEGAAALGLMLGLLALSVPVMGVTGLVLWLSARRGGQRITQNAPAREAETILLVGSEGGSSWGFAATLHAALRAHGQKVHAAPMSDFEPSHYARAKRIIILTATYGAGEAPSSAKGFLEKLAACKTAPAAPLAVLGFGDSSFPEFCAFAGAVRSAANAKGWHEFLPPGTVDRQSPQDFARWGVALGQAMSIPLTLDHQAVKPETVELTLISRRDFGAEVQAPSAILRFALPKQPLWRRVLGKGFGSFVAGDLIGIVPEGSAVPRFYSLASGVKDGFIEIAVRKLPGGLCSGQLLAMEPGGAVSAFLRPNPAFHPATGRAPLILIGAGTGVGPLAGFIRANAQRRHMHLFFGLRHEASDFLYSEELDQWQREGRLTRLVTAASRGERPRYVQDALRAEAADIIRLIAGGARVMVCGGREMAAGVADALGDILMPLGLTPAALKLEGRYVEDVY